MGGVSTPPMVRARLRACVQLCTSMHANSERGVPVFFPFLHTSIQEKKLVCIGMAVKAVIFDAWSLVLKNNLSSAFINFESSRGLPKNFLNEMLRKSGCSMNLLYRGKINASDAQSRLEQEVASRGYKLSQNLDLVNFLTSIRSEIRVNGDVRDALQCE